ncbi:ABC-type transport system involved in multi-copper enzyme maturation, permease component [Oceanobacillus limi]|uniref:ABC-type transport system involved in multi-copper enzyme maturation, permease component n=1 Tax=Oceanobacillus limi TaxID=930131 RepID=A0A1I0HH13_9BACI|nr:ABC transporter permease subunit [Oceanobacillus limi]SET83177.1 ABC-type transport system involved in multi-copper enzyme maturation, permease component [Oceanobacillus limi]
MINIFLFEMKKIVKSSFFIIALLLLSLFILGYYIFVHMNTVRSDEIVAEIDSRVHTQEKHLQELYDVADEAENQDDIHFQEEYLSKEKEMLSAYQEEDWFTVLDQEIKQDESQPPNTDYRTSTHPTSFTAKTRLEHNKWLRDNGIQPVLPLDMNSWITIYDVDFGGHTSAEQFIKDRSAKYSSSGVYYLQHVFQLLFGLIGPIFFLLLFGDLITKEGFDKNGPIHLLKTQPIRYYQILGGKLFAIVVTTVLAFSGISVLAILIGTIADRFGDFDYPVLIYGSDYAYSFMEMGIFLLNSAILSFMVFLFCYSLLFLFSVIAKKTLLAVGLAIATILIGIQWSEAITLSTFAPYIPFYYFSVTEVITNELAVTLQNFDFSYRNGLIVLGIYSGLLYALTYVISIFQIKSRY